MLSGERQTKKENVYVTNSLNCTKLDNTTILLHRVPYIDPQCLKNIVIGWTQSKVSNSTTKIMVIRKVTWEGIYSERITDLGHALLKLNERNSMSPEFICFGKFGR